MPRGGARPNAGRPKKGEARPHIRAGASGEAAVAYEFLTAAIQDRDLPFADRLRAAATLLPFEKRRVKPLPPFGAKERKAERAAELVAEGGPYAPGAPPLRAEEADRDIYAPGLPPEAFRN